MNVLPQELSELHTFSFVPQTGAHTILVGRPSRWAAWQARWPGMGSALFLTLTSLLTLPLLLLPTFPAQTTGRPGSVTLRASNTDYRAESLLAQVVKTAAMPEIAAAVGPLATPAGMSRCLEQLGLSTAQVSFADLASFNKVPAAVLQVDLPGGSSQIWVVSPECRLGYDGLQFFQSR